MRMHWFNAGKYPKPFDTLIVSPSREVYAPLIPKDIALGPELQCLLKVKESLSIDISTCYIKC